MIRVLLVDDQEKARAGLRSLLRERDGFSIVGECEDGDEVAAAVAAHHPDIVLMDVRMHRMSGTEATTALAKQVDAPPVLIVTTYGDEDTVVSTLAAGAAGFLLKDSPAEDVARATRAV